MKDDKILPRFDQAFKIALEVRLYMLDLVVKSSHLELWSVIKSNSIRLGGCNHFNALTHVLSFCLHVNNISSVLTIVLPLFQTMFFSYNFNSIYI